MSEAAPAEGGQGNTAPAPAPTAPATPAVSWLGEADAVTVGYVQNKGWQKPSDVIDGYRNLEKFHGVPADKLLRLPAENADKAELDAFYGKLGRPADASKYEIKLPDGIDPTFADWAKSTFHELGLTATQGKILSEKWGAQTAAMQTKALETYQATIEADNANLKREWAHGYDGEVAKAQGAAKQLGLTGEQIDSLEKTMGFAGLMKMMASIGNKMGEDSFVSSASTSGFGGMTPGQAQARIQQLTADKEWSSKYLNGGANERAEMERLQKYAFPE